MLITFYLLFLQAKNLTRDQPISWLTELTFAPIYASLVEVHHIFKFDLYSMDFLNYNSMSNFFGSFTSPLKVEAVGGSKTWTFFSIHLLEFGHKCSQLFMSCTHILLHWKLTVSKTFIYYIYSSAVKFSKINIMIWNSLYFSE